LGWFIPAFIKLFGLLLKHRKFPYVIPPGGSSPIGAIGYVNAGFELKEQVAKGLMPEPDQVFIPVGTMGTSVGLMLGFRAAGLKSRIVSVRVVDEKFGNKEKFIKLFRKTMELILSLDPSFPLVEINDDDVDIRHNFFGEQYARFTKQGMEAVSLVAKLEGIRLDGTYTGKAMAALIDQVRSHGSINEVNLFWNTYNARDFSDTIRGIEYNQLPRCFHRYFEGDIQPLDKHNPDIANKSQYLMDRLTR
jgi:D-cysteine desulfhydrase